MSSVPDTNRFAPPTAHVEDVSSGSDELAGRGTRLGAALIDGLIQAGAFYLLGYTLMPSLLTGTHGRGVFATLILQLAVSLALFVALQTYLLATQGQTIGKKLLGLRIVRSDGERASVGRLLFVRYFLGWIIMMLPVVGAIYALLDSLLVFRESRKCLHDNIADTIVVKA